MAMVDLHEITIEWQKKEWLGEGLLHELHCHVGAIQRIFDMAILRLHPHPHQTQQRRRRAILSFKVHQWRDQTD
jgi:hypothetical protein